MPIASLKIGSGQLPYRFTLDNAVSMSPNDKLSNHAEVMISARVSKSGQAMAQSGDLQGKVGPVKLGQQGVAIVIDTVVPYFPLFLFEQLQVLAVAFFFQVFFRDETHRRRVHAVAQSSGRGAIVEEVAEV